MIKYGLMLVMRRIIILAVIIFFVLGEDSFSQVSTNKDVTPDKVKKGPDLMKLNRNYLLPKLLPLLNSDKFDMKHSYSMFYSGGAMGGIKGMYSNTIFYRFSDKMDMRFQLNYLMQPGWLNSQNSRSSNMNNGVLLPNFDFRYKPTKNTSLRFSYRSTSPYLWGNPYYYNYSASPLPSLFWRDEHGLW